MGSYRLKKSQHPHLEGPLVVVIMDGVGISPQSIGNAVAQAETPNLRQLERDSFFTLLQAHGQAVGMPSNQDMGNSEVGHNTLGAGRVFAQGAQLVETAIKTRKLEQAPVWNQLIARVKTNNTPLHLLGLLSDGNVHSHIQHLFHLLRIADKNDVNEVYLHVLLDGRDVAPQSAEVFIKETETLLAEINRHPKRRYKIASGGGRMSITMDRYGANWPMVEKGWKTHVCGEGQHFSDALSALDYFRNATPNICDQDLPPFVIAEDRKPLGPIRDGASVLAFNFRGDRMLQLCSAFEDEHFEHFHRQDRPDVLFAGMTLYDGDSNAPKKYLVSPPAIEDTFGELLAEQGRQQFACSETQKYGHVTYFWNGNRSSKFSKKHETYLEIPSLTTPFEEQPQMRAAEITEQIIKASVKTPFDFARINYANGDMIGHTGNFSATVKAMEHLDQNLGRLAKHILSLKGGLIITADHGNAEEMFQIDTHTSSPLRDTKGHAVPKTSHSLNPVPCMIYLPDNLRQHFRHQKLSDKGLANVAATAATLMGYEAPEIYEPSLVAPAQSQTA